MKNTKIELRFFTIPEWKKEQDYLRQQHKNGWSFVKVNFIGLYHFEKCTPEDVIYQLDYNPEGINQKDEYIQMFRDCKWEYLQDYVGYSYFRKSASEMNGIETIFCDDASRTDLMKRIFKGRMIPLLCNFFLIILPNIYIQSHMDSSISRILTGALIMLLFAYLIIFIHFGIEFRKCLKSLQK